ncbi:MAG: PLP-dependent aminotransferase family protein [Vicinamibacteria bacterium]|nr:PLP-dependent aminotransferase family protein [Vicinamibacteria bacterium]
MTYQRFFSHAAAQMRESAIRKMGTLGTRIPDLISFAPGYPDPATFPRDRFQEIAASLLSGSDGSTLQYGPTRGFRPLVEALDSILLSRAIVSRFEQRLITSGSQQGLDLVAKVLIDPGDAVLVELPTYAGAISVFSNALADMVGVPQEDDGIDLAALDHTVARLRREGRRVRLLYLVPNFQNPTGLLIGLDKRRALLDWAERADVLIVEDDPYGDLYFPDSATAEETRPIKADDHGGRVVYLSSFSKTLAPGFRTAWVVAPEALAAKLEIAKQATDLCTGALDQRVVHQAIVQGVLAGLAPHLRAHYQAKCAVMQEAIERDLGGLVTCAPARGGFFLWATLPPQVDADSLLPRALAAAVTYVAGGAFFVDDGGANTLRLSFSQPTHDRIREGITRLAGAIRAELEAQSTPSRDNGISVPRG